MVYITLWDEFFDQSVQLFRAYLAYIRYTMKYRHCDGKLVLKVTDNKEKSQVRVSPTLEEEFLKYLFTSGLGVGPLAVD